MLKTTLYNLELFRFLQTVTIKNAAFATASKNTDVSETFRGLIPDEQVPYYRHLNGEYVLKDETTVIQSMPVPNSVLYTKWDLPMQVRAIDAVDAADDLSGADGQNIIALTKPMLAKYVKTANRCRYHAAAFDALCAAYPEQVELIRTILFPVKTDPVAAGDYSLIGYSDGHLYPTEQTSMVQALITFLTMFRTRWVVPEYSYEEYYPITQWALLWNYLYQRLFVTRIQNIHTDRVHPDLMWEYLEGYGLGPYRSALTQDQQLFLYRNIEYLMTNRGKHSNMLILVEHILRTYHADLKSKTMVLDTTNSAAACTVGLTFANETVDTTKSLPEAASLGTDSLSLLISKEYASGLEQTPAVATPDQSEKLSRTAVTALHTKLLEIQRSSACDLFTQLYINFVFSSLMRMVEAGTVDLAAELPDQEVVLSGVEAIAMASYCLYRSANRTESFATAKLKALPTTVPIVMAYPTVLLSGSAQDRTAWIDATVPKTFPYAGKTVALSTWVPVATWLNAIPKQPGIIRQGTDLITYLDSVFAQLRQHVLRARTNCDAEQALAIQELYSVLFAGGSATLPAIAGATTYAQYFSRNRAVGEWIEAMETSTTAKTDLESAAFTILDQLIPMVQSPYFVKDLTTDQYRQLRQLFIQMCSYTVAFIDVQDQERVSLVGPPLLMGSTEWSVTVTEPIDYTGQLSVAIAEHRMSLDVPINETFTLTV